MTKVELVLTKGLTKSEDIGELVEAGLTINEAAICILINNKEQVNNCIYHSSVGGRSFIVDIEEGIAYFYQNTKYGTKIDNGTVYLREYLTRDWIRVIFGNDIINQGFKIYRGSSGAGDKKSIAFKYKDPLYGNVILCEHVIIKAMTEGYIVLDAMGENRLYDIHHKNGDNRCNKDSNTEIIPTEVHIKQHSRMRRKKVSSL